MTWASFERHHHAIDGRPTHIVRHPNRAILSVDLGTIRLSEVNTS
jgi:hypothetical protein